MPLNLQATRQHLQDFDFRKLFINELGWNNPPFALKPADAEAKGGIRFHRAPVAVLSGIHVFEITTPGGAIPDAKTRAAIHTAVSALAAENLLIFTDTARTQSLWYWVKREAGKSHARDHLYVKGQPGDLFLSKLAALVVDISELDARGNIPLTEVARRLKNALDVERVTKKFYGDFDIQRLEFTELIRGIKDDHQRRWYASVLMNRLMFIWFLQKKFFLDGRNSNYLTDKLAFSGQKLGADKFYPVFLNTLFFEGFAKPEPARSRETNALLGKIRYLNGGLFLPHHVELEYGFGVPALASPSARPPEGGTPNGILIPDRAFENVFHLFGRYSWNLNDTPGGQADEINPDVLGYIFEKYINQKEFGAYYTRPEMTGYLCERTIFKLVLDRVNQALVGDDVRSLTSNPGKKSETPHVVSYNSISDLLLNLDAKICRALVLEILPALRLLDPACGSGAFLVAAMKVLINIYSAILGKVELEFLGDPDLKKWHDEVHGDHRAPAYYIKKRIITENLFGVDIMEEATEIARLRLFLALVASAQTEDQLEPLPNIDFNILAGNSLIGLLHVDPKKFDGDEVGRVSPLRAGAGVTEDGAHGVTRPTQGRMTLVHEPGKGDLGFTVETKTAPTTKEKQSAFMAQKNAEKFAAILEDKNKSIELYRKHAFASVSGSARASRAAVGDLADGPGRDARARPATPEGGCAPQDFADLVDQNERVLRLREHIEKVRADSYARLNQMLLDEFNALGIQFEQATWDDRKNDTGKPEKRGLKLADLEALHPFHWGYEFDKVMADGGFDGIITNPPWEIFKPQAKEFFKQHSELVIQRKMDIKTFEKEQAKLLKDPEVRGAWLNYLNEYPHVSAYFRSATQFKNQSSVVNGKKASGDINLYKLFLEQCFNLLCSNGRCGIVIPTSIYTDLGAKQLREILFTHCHTDTMFGLSNERFIFEGVDHRFKVCLLAYEKGGPTSAFEAAFRMHPHEAVHPDRLDSFLHDQTQHVSVSVPLIRKISPDSLSVVEFKSPEDVAVVEKVARFPLLGAESPPPWHVRFQSEFHMTNDSHLFQATKKPGLWSLYEGKMVHQFDHRFEDPRYWLNEKACRKAILGTERDAGQKLDYQDFRLGFRKIARNTDERTMIATIIPPNFHAENFQSVKTYEDGKRLVSPEVMFYLCAVMNSFTLDYLLRLRVSANVNFFYVYQLPVPRLTAADAAFGPIVKRAAQLICTTPEFDALAKEVGLGSHKSGVTAPAARSKLRAELDGLIAHLYGLTESEFAHILTTFPLVAQPVKNAALEAYRAVVKT